MQSRWRNTALVVWLALGFASSAHAVGLAGNYHESSGLVVNLPQNPPAILCDGSADNARCHFKQRKFFGQGSGGRSTAPAIGVPGATSIAGDPRTVGAPFTLPTGFMHQDRNQAAALLKSIGIYLATSFEASAPDAERDRNLGLTAMEPGFVANPDTRVFAPRTFSTANRSAFGQNNGLATTDPNHRFRQAIDTTVTTYIEGPSGPIVYNLVDVTYRGGGFGGTAGLLLDGRGELYLAGPNIDAIGTPAQAPVIVRDPIGDDVAGNPAIMNGVGWDYVTTTHQPAGSWKTFGLDPHDPLPGGFCTSITWPAQPPGCNVVVGFDTYGGTLPIAWPSVMVERHLFPWTTGTVTITRMLWDGRNFTIYQTISIQGRGHDVISTTSMGLRRNVGLVAGSYTIRTDANGWKDVDIQLAGMNLVFTPEPSSSVALVVGVALLGGLAARRGRRIRDD